MGPRLARLVFSHTRTPVISHDFNDCQEISNTLWAFGKQRIAHKELFEAPRKKQWMDVGLLP